MKDCERCKNVAICKLEKTRDKCAFVNPFEEIPIIHGKAELEEHDKQIRNKAIDELKNKICMHFADWQYSEADKVIKDIIELASESVEEIAEQMKEV